MLIKKYKSLNTLTEGMTPAEINFKHNVLQYLREDGFPTFADYLDLFHFNFLTSAEAGTTFVAATIPEKGIILVNPNVEADGISMLLRHEAGHNIFKDREHFFAKLKKLGINTPSDLAYELANIVGDYNIANFLYDKDDQITAKELTIHEKGKDFSVPGLVTELDFPENPEYWTMDFDQLWDVFVKNYDRDDLAKKIVDDEDEGEEKELDPDFVDGWNDAIDSFNNGDITIEDIKDYFGDNLKEYYKDLSNPFSGKKGQGWDSALKAILNNLNSNNSNQSNKGGANNKLKQPNLPNRNKNNSNNPNNKNNQSNSKDNSSNSDKTFDKLSPSEKQEIIDKVLKARDKAKDAIDDYGNLISDNFEDSINNELSEISKEAEEAKSQSDANKIKARLDKIASFWDDLENISDFNKDMNRRTTYKNLKKELLQAHRNALKRNYNYKPMTINQIVNNIVHTIKSQTKDIRSSSWSRYNDRAADLGYVAPGRYTDKKLDIPDVVFYFDVSGSWSGNKEKIDMGHRIEEGLKKLQQEKKINLYCRYFGTEVHDTFTTTDEGNSDEPIPHALGLLQSGNLDNIIIMTDDNPNPDPSMQVKVPGYAWLLFYDTVSDGVVSCVSGRKGTSICMIDHGKKESE